jgi:hypothetical protein
MTRWSDQAIHVFLDLDDLGGQGVDARNNPRVEPAG